MTLHYEIITWENESELQEMYLNRKSFAFNSDNRGIMFGFWVETLYTTSLQTQRCYDALSLKRHDKNDSVAELGLPK